MSYLEPILVHPVRRQIFGDTSGQTFYMTRDCVIKTNILCFFSQATIGKNIKKHTKTNILLFSADIHTYKLTFVSFFYVFFFNLPLSNLTHRTFRGVPVKKKTPCIMQWSLRMICREFDFLLKYVFFCFPTIANHRS